ncbi:MAG TPA: hypothetical protein VJ343_00740 [archaeon]|nr:hypothetical protein [archaeon]
MNKLIGIGIAATVLIIVIAALALLTFNPFQTPPENPPGSAEDLAYGAVEQELDQAISNITEQDIEDALLD